MMEEKEYIDDLRLMKEIFKVIHFWRLSPTLKSQYLYPDIYVTSKLKDRGERSKGSDRMRCPRDYWPDKADLHHIP